MIVIGKGDLTEERVRKYLGITEKGLKKLKIAPPEKSHNRKIAEDFLTMAKSYYSDAKFFFEKGELANAFACVNYAHGWLDAGVRIGFFDVGEDYVLFTPAE